MAKGTGQSGVSGRLKESAGRYDDRIHHRRSIRLREHDYSAAGEYFVTICCAGHRCLFGELGGGEMRLNRLGRIVEEEWSRSAELRTGVELGQHVVMPNHFHGIWVLAGRGETGNPEGTARRAPTSFGEPVVGSLATLVRAFKSAVTRRVNQVRGTLGAAVWQRNYYEHVIRDSADYDRIVEYIATNPQRWAEDRLNPANKATGPHTLQRRS